MSIGQVQVIWNKSFFPSVFHTEEYNILRHCKANATRCQTRPQKMHNHHLMQLEGVALPQWVVFLAG